MGGFLSALGTYPEILGEYYVTTVTADPKSAGAGRGS